MYAITDTSYRAIASESDLVAGERAVVEVPQALLDAVEAMQARSRRTGLLRSSDWTQVSDSPLSSTDRAAWAVYRQALRDLPQTPGFPDVAWPMAPALAPGAGTEPPPHS